MVIALKGTKDVAMAEDSDRPPSELAEVVSLRLENAELKRQLAEVRGDRALLEQLFNSTRAIAYLFDEDGHFLRWSPHFYEQVLGYTSAEMAAHTVLDTIVPEDREHVREAMRSAARDCGQAAVECRALAKTGPSIALLCYSVRFMQEGRLIFAGQAVPIEDRLRAETQLKESEERFSKAFQSSPAIMAITDIATGRFIEVNQRTVDVLGYSREEMLGRTSLELGIWRDPVQRQRLVTGLNTTGRHESELVQFVGKSGAVRDLEWSAEIVTIGGSRLMLTLLNDVTERLAAEGALKAKDEQFRRLVRDSRDVIAVTDSATRITTVVGAIEKVFGFTPNELFGHDLLSDLHPEDQARFERFLTELTGSAGATMTMEGRLRHGDGHWVPVELIATNLLNDPDIAGIVWNARDISARVQADAERAKLEGRLRQAAKMEAIGRLAGGVAHDFNNMLTVIAGNIELARIDPTDLPALSEHLTEIERAAKSATALTRQLLAFSRKQPFEAKTVEFDSLIGELERMLRRVIGEDIILSACLHGGNSLVRVDPGQFEQILLNLAVNARDAMPSGGTLAIETTTIELDEVFCRTHTAARPGQFVLMSVTDSGHGIPPDAQAHIFEPFFTTKELGHGTGLGLATVFGIVERAGGAIDVYSEVEIGTTFKIYLPCVTETTAPAKTLPRVSAPPSAKGEALLLVEDDSAVRTVAVAFLNQLGYQTYAFASGTEALRFIERDSPSIALLLTDVVMPEMNGRELATQLVKLRPSIRVLFTSGYAESVVTQRQVLDAGAHFISKPYSLNALGRKLREILD